ncbi:MAG TPA: glutathione S-transferase family protein [Polyangiaceae bacterium]|jgi:glutathione S-transferase
MSITYYYAPMSTAVRTTWAIEELGVPCERVKLDIQKKETKAEKFLALNPNGQVPLLVVDGLPIFESTAILLYLGETYGVDKGLYPAPGLKRAEALRWIIWGNVGLYDAISRWSRNTSSYVPDEQKNAKAAEVAKNDLDGAMRILDHALAGKSYLVDDKFSLADLAPSSYLGWLKFMGYDYSSFKNVQAWADRCLGRPAAVKTNSPE